MYYAPKSSVVKVKKAAVDFKRLTADGCEYAKTGDYYSTNLLGESMVIPEEEFESNYVELEIENNQRSQKKTLAEEYSKSLLDGHASSELRLNQEEDESYINGESNGWGMSK